MPAYSAAAWRPSPAKQVAACRLLLAAPFVVSGISKAADFTAATSEVGTLVPFGSAGLIAALVILVQLGGSAGLLAGGRWSTTGGAILAAFTVAATFMAHAWWLNAGPDRQQEMNTFFEHAALVGGTPARRRASARGATMTIFADWIGADITRLAPAASVAIAVASAAYAGSPLVFDGRIEPEQRVVVANHLSGAVEAVLFRGGEAVSTGDLLVVMDSDGLQIAVRTAEAVVAEAAATLREAEDAAAREEDLLGRGIGTRARALEADVARDVAQARLDAAQAVLDGARLDLRRARIVAPITGRIGRPLVFPGAYVEAIAGTALAEIVSVDPVLVSYAVPYEARMQAMAEAEADTVPALFAKITLSLELPDGALYPEAGHPKFESASIDPATGMLTTWAEFPNPKGVLVPGLSARVHASIHMQNGASQ